MSTHSPIAQPAAREDQALVEADAAAVLEQLVSGKPLDPAVVERVRARAELVTEAVRRNYGMVDDATFQSLLDDEG